MDQTRALVVTHGNLGAELVRVTELILGPAGGLEAMSNQGLANLDLTKRIQAWLAGAAGRPAVILVDDYAGSCATAARLACEERAGVAIIAGVNLAMLLSFLTWRDDADLAELTQRIITKGREAISRVGPAR